MLNYILIIGFYLLVSESRPFYCPVGLRFCVRLYSDITVRFRPIFAYIKEGLKVADSLKAVRYGPDGEIDLDTVDGLVRSLALGDKIIT